MTCDLKLWTRAVALASVTVGLAVFLTLLANCWLFDGKALGFGCFRWTWLGFGATVLGLVEFFHAWFWFSFWCKSLEGEPRNRAIGTLILVAMEAIGRW